MSKIRVLIADDHAVVREGLERLISDQPDMLVVAQAADGEQAIRASCEHDPHVILLDMRMPRVSGVAAMQQLRACCPKARILALSMYEDASYVRAALSAGAHAYVAKRSSSATLLSAIRALRAGERFVDAEVASAAQQPAFADSPAATLSTREREVLRLLVRGHTGREMAATLGISKSTADTYRARVFRKLGVECRAELLATVQGLLDSGMATNADVEVP